ncbi:MAG: hypothetical protein K2I53_04475, partial [Lachnospiraceae bacterium]|nr:hypothetical protein [Lachnospiraceae bacterium]
NRVVFLFVVLVEESCKRYWIGHTTRYLKAAREEAPGENLQNHIVGGRLVSFLTEDVLLVVD